MQSNFKPHVFRPATLILVVLVGLGLAGAAIAQAIQANSDTQDPPVYVPGIAYGLIEEGGQAFSATGTIFPDDNPPPSQALAPSVPTASYSYYFVSGATLVPRDSVSDYTYDGLGCVHFTTNDGNILLNTDLQLPLGSEIKYLRLYYYDSNNPGYITGFISRYPPSQSATDIAVVSSPTTGTPGAGIVVSSRITQTVDYENAPYLLIARPSAPASNLRICGMRVAYYAPVTGYTFMPLLSKSSH